MAAVRGESPLAISTGKRRIASFSKLLAVGGAAASGAAAAASGVAAAATTVAAVAAAPFTGGGSLAAEAGMMGLEGSTLVLQDARGRCAMYITIDD